MQKILAILMLFLTLVGCTPRTETGKYAGEAMFFALAPIIYPVAKIHEGIESEISYRNDRSDLKKPEKGTPGISKEEGYFSGRIYKEEYVIFENFCDDKGYFLERKAYLPEGQLISELKYNKGIPVEEKIYYPNGKLAEHWIGKGKRGNRLRETYSYISYDENGKLEKNTNTNLELSYIADILTYNEDKVYYSIGDILTYKEDILMYIEPKNGDTLYYPTGAPKSWRRISKEEEQKLLEEKKYLKDLEEIYYKNPSKKTKYNGKYKVYSPNGNIHADLNFKNGYLNGEQKIYFWNSKQIYSIENWKNGEMVGINKKFYSNGKLRVIKELKNDSIVEKGYLLDGKIAYEYEKNKNKNSFKIYLNGQLIEVVENGKLKKYYYGGQLKFSEEKRVVFGKKVTVDTDWYYDGKIKKEKILSIPDPSYSNERMEWTREYYPNGKLKYEERDYYQIYKKVEYFYDENGKLLKKKKS